jgi:hypothetical protein
LGNLFEGIQKLYILEENMKNKDIIDGMTSAEGETIKFSPKTIKIRTDRGIEHWL